MSSPNFSLPNRKTGMGSSPCESLWPSSVPSLLVCPPPGTPAGTSAVYLGQPCFCLSCPLLCWGLCRTQNNNFCPSQPREPWVVILSTSSYLPESLILWNPLSPPLMTHHPCFVHPRGLGGTLSCHRWRGSGSWRRRSIRRMPTQATPFPCQPDIRAR